MLGYHLQVLLVIICYLLRELLVMELLLWVHYLLTPYWECELLVESLVVVTLCHTNRVPYQNQDQDANPLSGTSSILQKPQIRR